MADRWVHKIEGAWQRPPRWLLLLLPLEYLFRAMAAARRWAYGNGWLRSAHPGVPVIVVGNISVGGTGKTPLVMALAEHLLTEGFVPAIVSRGYGGEAKGPLRVTPATDAQRVGDEAVLMASSVTCPVYIGRDRAAAAAMAARAGADVILCDDGLQHYALARDIEIVALHGEQPHGNGHCLPVGPLRESPRRLATVDFVLHRNGDDPATAVHFVPDLLRRLDGSEDRPSKDPGFGPQVNALAAIARPQRFFTTLRSLGFSPREFPLRDHQPIDASLLATLTDSPLVMTAKDAVKCTSPSHRQAHSDAWVLHMRTVFPDAFLAAFSARVKSLGRHRKQEVRP